ncbi:MAG TPA: metal ABC transporter substrate-binding protein [Jiangellaceae bacterium]|nr:metal ABC transporter substrate-binding protein [Jiangellaceae bacterium]
MRFWSRRPAYLASAAAMGTILAGCGGDEATGGDLPSVAASFYPLAFVAERIGGGDVRVVNLTPPGVESHDLELSPRQVAEIAAADLVVYERGFQPSVDEAVEQNAGDARVEVTEVVPLEHLDEDEHGDLAGDPHVWLDPTLLARIADAVADALATAVPVSAGAFRERAEALGAELTALDEEYSAGMRQCERNVVVTTHEAFGYLAHRYGLEMVGISGLSPDAEPSPARLAEVGEVIADEAVTTVFYERLVSPKVAETLADDLGVVTAVLDPIEGLTDETEDEDYFTLMRANLGALEEANGCT